MTLGHGCIDDDVGENLLIVNKMAKVFREGKLWSRNKDGKGIIKELKNIMPQLQGGSVSSTSTKTLPQTALIIIQTTLLRVSIMQLSSIEESQPKLYCKRLESLLGLDLIRDFICQLIEKNITVTVKGSKSVAYDVSMLQGAFLACILSLHYKKRGRLEKHKKRKNRLPIPPQLSSIQLSGTKRCKKCKQMGHNILTCGQPRDENGRLKYKEKP
ncbi:hypothetical protein Cgig2_019956 [Carnegiea gigantea]|uniref:Uncharacterized protein n=1 Tax=Carnegiea gigantea TaxID=171969 RepID=A0A9Q1GTN8_9CARY|nr:hypothetical protein Cgig2_019956 [Carnegiea gigantea]